MIRPFRLPVVSAALFVVAVSFVASAEDQNHLQPRDIDTRTEWSQQGAAPEVASEKEKLTPEEYQAPCGPTEKAYVADLCEQRRMAKAAERQVLWVKSQFWATIGEIILLVSVVLVSGWAALEARKAAKASQETADWTIRVQRPFILPADVRFEKFDTPTDGTGIRIIQVHMNLLNVGSSPAFIKGIAITQDICLDGHHGAKEVRPGNEWIGHEFIRPDGKWSSDLPAHVFHLDEQERKKVIDHELTIYVYGFVRYADAHNIMRRTGFCYEFIPGGKWDDNEKFQENGVVATGPSTLWYDREERPKETK